MNLIDGYVFIATQNSISRIFGSCMRGGFRVFSYEILATNGLNVFDSRQEMEKSAQSFAKNEYPRAEIQGLHICLSIPENFWDRIRLMVRPNWVILWEVSEGTIMVGSSQSKVVFATLWSEFGKPDSDVIRKIRHARDISNSLKGVESTSKTLIAGIDYQPV